MEPFVPNDSGNSRKKNYLGLSAQAETWTPHVNTSREY